MKQSKTLIRLTMIALASGLTAGQAAEEVDITKIPPASDKKIDFVKDIQPLLEKSCVSCHSGRRPKSKYDMTTRENTIKGGSSEEKSVVIGKSEKSPMVHYIADLVEEMEMPPLGKREKYQAFTKAQIGLIRSWIDQGAKWPKEIVLKAPES